jgi:hypothetical protein
MAYSKDFKGRTVAYKQEGHTFEQLREAFGIPSDRNVTYITINAKYILYCYFSAP